MQKKQIRVVSETVRKRCTAIAAVSGYEPWPMRSIASVKETLSEGIPVLMRVHCAADYPTGSEELNRKLDMESHAVLLVGYDDYRQVFNIVDPWPKNQLGEFSGRRELSYEDYCLLMVNGTAEKATILALPSSTLELRHVKTQRFLCLRIGFYRPRGYILDESRTFITGLETTFSFRGIQITRRLKGKCAIGDLADIACRVPENIEGTADVQVSTEMTVEGERPYRYRDSFTYEFTEEVQLGFGAINTITGSPDIPIVMNG